MPDQGDTSAVVPSLPQPPSHLLKGQGHGICLYALSKFGYEIHIQGRKRRTSQLTSLNKSENVTYFRHNKLSKTLKGKTYFKNNILQQSIMINYTRKKIEKNV